MSDEDGSQGQSANRAALAATFGAQRTERLALRPVQAGDGPALFAIDGDPATHQFNPPGSAAPDLANSEARLCEWLRHWDVDGVGYWAILLAEAPDVIGFGGVQRIIWRERDALNLYYRFSPRAWGHGYATEMARVAVTLARAHLPQWPIIARVRPANVPSLRVAERAGLLRRSDLDDAEHAALALGWES